MACVAFGQNHSDGDTLLPRFLAGPVLLAGGGTETVDLLIPGFTAECGVLQHGKSFGWMAGGLFELPFTRKLGLQFRLGAMGRSGDLRMSFRDAPLKDSVTGIIAEPVVDHVVTFRGIRIEGSFLARYSLFGDLRAQGGVTIARTLGERQAYRQEAITPSNLLLSNNQRELELFSGDHAIFAAAPVVLGAQLGLSYDLPISRRSTLSPEISLSFPLTSHTASGPWRSLALQGGLALRFGIPRDLPPPPRIDTPVVVVPRPPTLVTAIVTEPQIVTVRIDEYDSLEVLPLLNQLFFDERSSDLRDGYRQLTPEETRRFGNSFLTGSALDVYYQILNLVGLRMREERRDAKLTINGYRNGRENDPAIAMARAERVKRYLVDVWGLAPGRITVKGGALPPNPSRENTSEGYEENARVELSASDPNILKPIARNLKHRIASPPAITFYPKALAEAGVARWTLEMVGAGREVWRTFEGNGEPPDSIVWDWQSTEGELPSIPMSLSYSFTVIDSSGRATTTDLTEIDVIYQSVEQKLEHRVNDTAIASYSLLLFNFDSPKVSGSDQDLISLIADAVKEKAFVRLIGYTDSLGEREHNYQLAMARAREVARLLNPLVPDDVRIVVDEGGGERERFPYTTPEGRSHCRTVVIEVRTPVVHEPP